MEKDQNQTEIKNASDEKEANLDKENLTNSEKEIQKEPEKKSPEEKCKTCDTPCHDSKSQPFYYLPKEVWT